MPPKAQPGEGIVVVLDVGPKTRLGLPIDQTFFNQAKSCLINILQRKIFADKCRDRVAVVLFGTDVTDNRLAAPGQYQHITVYQDLQLVDWGCLEKAKELPRGSHDGDWVDAVVVAMDLMNDNIEFSSKKLVLLTDFSGDFSDDKVDNIISGMKSLNIDLNVIGPELSEDGSDDDPGEGPSNGHPSGGVTLSWSGKVKSTTQLAGEALIETIVSSLDGIFCTFDEAIPQLIFYQKKAVKSSNWNTLLEIGPELQIPVTGRIKIKKATPNTWKRCHARDENIKIIKERSYHKLDDESTQVDDEEVIDGYRYGTSVVPFSESDNQMSYSSGAESSQLTVLGFTRSENCTQQFRAGDQAMVITAREGDEEAAVALSAIIHALAEMDVVAVVRKVFRKGLKPVLGALLPKITADNECLVFVGLAFQEDYRSLLFPSLERYIKNLTEDQNTAMDSLIDLMSLTVDDDEGEVEELLEPSSVLNPHLQNFYNCLTDRAVNPGRPLPAPQIHVLNILKTPAVIEDKIEEIADTLVKLFPTTEIVRRTKRERENLDAPDDEGNTSKRSRDEDPMATEDVQFGSGVSHITSATPLEDYKTLIKNHFDNFLPICDELCEVLLQLTETLSPQETAIDTATINKILNCLEACRADCRNISPSHYNKILKKLKDLITGRNLKNTSLWGDLKTKNLGLLTKSDNPNSEVTDEGAEKFFSEETEVVEEKVVVPEPQMDNQDYDDLLDDL